MSRAWLGYIFAPYRRQRSWTVVSAMVESPGFVPGIKGGETMVKETHTSSEVVQACECDRGCLNRIEIKIGMIIDKALIGPWSKHVALRFSGPEKINVLQPNAKIKKLTTGSRKANRNHEQQQISASYWSAQPRQCNTSGPPYTAPNPQLPRQHSRTDPPTVSRRSTTPAPTFSGL